MDQMTQQVFSTWQIHLIRDALEGYRMFTPDHESGKSPLSWNALRERITVATDVEFGKDDLRQFVEGKKKGTHEYRVPEKGRLQAISDFLIEEEQFDWETVKNQETLDTRLPLYVSYFLRSAKTPDSFKPPTTLLGNYEAVSHRDNTTLVFRLYISAGAGQYFSVRETVLSFYGIDPDVMDKVRKTNDHGVPLKSEQRSSGWGLVTPEDNIIIFQKNVDSKDNHFWKLCIEEFFWMPDPVDSLYLYRYDWPYPIDTRKLSIEDVRGKYFDESSPSVVKFKRMPEAS